MKKKKLKASKSDNHLVVKKLKKSDFVYYYPDMSGVGHLYQNQLNFETRAYTLKFIQGEIERMAQINNLLVRIFLSERTKNTFSKDLDIALLKKIYPDMNVEQLHKEERRSVWENLLLPDTKNLLRALRNE